ncbi:MAG: hypothetical protein ACD_75C01326G0001, partial [uncultured bacterium]
MVGDTVVPSANILELTDSTIKMDLPEVAVALDAAALTVKVLRNGLEATLAGAIVVQPRVILQDLDPIRGPPEGGKTITLYGVAFNNQMIVKFGGVIAGDLRLLNSSRLEARVPAGSFGYADVSVSSELFPDEVSVLKDGYFYANKETGSVNLSQNGHRSSPVTSIVVKDQLLYAVTGGSYDVVYRNGESGPTFTTSRAQLVISDISDPVHPELIYKHLADQEWPYHYNDTLPPDGFRSIALEDRELYLLGGNRLSHFDVTLAADPLLLEDLVLPATGNHLAVKDNVVYVSTADGIVIYRLLADRSLRHLTTLSADVLGGQPGKLVFAEDLLWVSLPSESRLVAIDLMNGLYETVNRMEALDLTGQKVAPDSFIIRNDLLVVSTGSRGTVVAYGLRPDGQSKAAAELKLMYLQRGGDMFAGELLLYGQTLYVAAGQGDLQIFNISSWLDNRFREQVKLKNYFALTGAVDAIGFGRGALYAGTAFVDSAGVPAENPFDSYAAIKDAALGGALNTIANNQLTIVSQTPQPGDRLQVDQPVKVQFNRILDPYQVNQFGEELFALTLSGQPVAGIVSAAINTMGTELIFRPLSPFIHDKEYQVRLSAALHDLHNQNMERDYRFRFTADKLPAPVIDSILPAYGSWRGGEKILITGEGFGNDSEVVIGGVEVPAGSMLSRTESEIGFILPSFSGELTESRLVGVAVINGDQRTFRAAGFTIVADPAITELGQYNRLTANLAAGDKRFLYNGGEIIAVKGHGLGPLTTILVNGKAAEDLRSEDANTLSFVVPDATVGTLTIEVTNTPVEQIVRKDAVFNDELVVEFESIKNGVFSRMARSGDVVFSVDAAGTKATLATTVDGVVPVVLAEIRLAGAANSLAVSELYAACSVGPNHEIAVYEIGNLYGPKLVNSIVNPLSVKHNQLTLAGNVFLALDGKKLHIGNVFGSSWEDVADGVLDFAVDRNFLYILLDDGATVEVRPLHDWQTVAAQYSHAVISPKKIAVAGQRLAIRGENSVEIGTLQPNQAGVRVRSSGNFTFNDLQDAAFAGDLLAVIAPSQGVYSLTLFDVDQLDESRSLVIGKVTSVACKGDLRRASHLRFSKEILEWLVDGNYYNLAVPLQNRVKTFPERYISQAQEIIGFAVEGSTVNWADVVLDVFDESDELQNGNTRLLGKDLQFMTMADSYQNDEVYRLDLFNQPYADIDGGRIRHDLPMYLKGAPLFGISEAEMQRLSPATALTRKPTDFSIRGVNLDRIESLRFNDITVPSWSVGEDGSSLTFTMAFEAAGLYSLVAEQQGAKQNLPVALTVNESLAVASLASNNSLGVDKVSDSGGNTISIAGKGLQGLVEVYWFEAGQGYQINQASKLNDVVYSENGLSFQAPPTVPGKEYRIVLYKPSTQEEVVVEVKMTGIDDTRPRLTGAEDLGYTSPVRLTFNEDIAVASFTVIASFDDYSGNGDEDVSHLFELSTAGNTILLQLQEGIELNHNRTYRVVIRDIKDLAGNQAVQGGPITGAGDYVSQFVSLDAIAPHRISLTRVGDNQAVTPAMQLTKGRVYLFRPASVDNRTGAKDLIHEIRISTDKGISFGPPEILKYGKAVSLPIYENYTGIAFQIRAIDLAGRSRESRFEAAVKDPEIIFSDFYTTTAANPNVPGEIEEMTRANICAVIQGDTDLLTKMEMQVFDKTYPVDITIDQSGSAKGCLSYLNPKLHDLSSDQVPVRVRVGYRFTGTAYNDYTYKLWLDKTPPDISIVSPPDGARVPMDEETSVLLKSFDRYGIDRIEIAINGGAWQEVTTPNMFNFMVVGLDPVTVKVRAFDPNGNESLADADSTITLTPFDPTKGEPKVELLSPKDGAKFHEGEEISLEVVIRNLLSAQLFMDVGGSETDQRNPAPVTIAKAEEDPERFAYKVVLPKVGLNLVVVLRLQAGSLSSRRFINVLKDDGVAEELDFTVLPPAKVLTGTQVWFNAAKPVAMTDFSTESSIEVEDPVGAAATAFPLGQGAGNVLIGKEGTNVGVTAILRDRSGNDKTTEKILEKILYIADAATVLYTPQGANLVTGDMVHVPGHDGVIWVVNNRAGGYEVRHAGGVILQENEGSLEKLQFTGTGLLAQENLGATRNLLFLPPADDHFGAPVRQPLLGDLLGGAGNTIYTRHGNLIDGYVLAGNDFVPAVGKIITEPIIATAVDHGRLYVLSHTDITAYRMGGEKQLGLQEVFRTNIDGDAEGLVVDGVNLAVWQHEIVNFYKILGDGSLVKGKSAAAGGAIHHGITDGELTWLLVDGPFADLTWQGYFDGDLVALDAVGSDLRLFAGNQLFERTADEGTIRQRPLNAVEGSVAFEPVLIEAPHGVLIDNASETATLGDIELSFYAETNQQLPAWKVWHEGSVRWFIPRHSLKAGQIQVVGLERSGVSLEKSLSRNETGNAILSKVTPQSATIITKGAVIPIVATLAADARAASVSLTMNGDSRDGAADNEAQSYQWFDAPNKDLADYQIDVDRHEAAAATLSLVDNDPLLEEVRIHQPRNNQPFEEGETLTIEYKGTAESGNDFRFAEIRLEDTNGNLIHRRFAADIAGVVTLTMPVIEAMETYYVVVRTFYGDSYYFSEAKTGIKAYPKLKVPALEIVGVAHKVMAGSEIAISIATEIPAGMSTSLDIYDDAGKLLAAGDTKTQLTVPFATAYLRMVATVSDGAGNSRRDERVVRVINPIILEQAAVQQKFQAAIPEVGDAWFAHGRGLYNLAGERVFQFDSTIKALAHLGDRLILSLADIGIIVVDPADDFRILSRMPMAKEVTGLAVSDNHLLVIQSGAAIAYTISGNAIENERAVSANGKIVDIQARDNGFVAVTDHEVVLLNNDCTIKYRQNGAFTSLAQLADYIYLGDSNGKLWVIDSNFSWIKSFDVNLPINRLLPLQSQLIGLSADNKLTFIDVNDFRAPVVVGKYSARTGDSCTRAILAGGKLWIGGESGAVYSLTRPASAVSTLYASSRPRGYIDDVAAVEGFFVAAAGDYGAVTYRADADQWREDVYPAMFTAATHAVAARGRIRYLLQQDYKRVVALDEAGAMTNIMASAPFTALQVTATKVV